jgi:hypothetical protein
MIGKIMALLKRQKLNQPGRVLKLQQRLTRLSAKFLTRVPAHEWPAADATVLFCYWNGP